MGRTIREQIGRAPTKFNFGQAVGVAMQNAGQYYGEVALEKRNAEALEASQNFQVDREERRYDASEEAAVNADGRRMEAESRAELFQIAKEKRGLKLQLDAEDRDHAWEIVSEARAEGTEMSREVRLLEAQIGMEGRANDEWDARNAISYEQSQDTATTAFGRTLTRDQNAEQQLIAAEGRANEEFRMRGTFNDDIADENATVQNGRNIKARLTQNDWRTEAATMANTRLIDRDTTAEENRIAAEDRNNAEFRMRGIFNDGIADENATVQNGRNVAAAALANKNSITAAATNNGYNVDAATAREENRDNNILAPQTEMLSDIPLMLRPKAFTDMPDDTRVRVVRNADQEFVRIQGLDPSWQTDARTGEYGLASSGVKSVKLTDAQMKFGIHGLNVRAGVANLVHTITSEAEGGLGYDLRSGTAVRDQALNAIGGAGNWFTTQEGQHYYAARTRAGEALFKGESGAAGSDAEARRYYSMFPSPGDHEGVRAMKLEMLDVSMKAFEEASKNGATGPAAAKAARAAADGAMVENRFDPDTGTVYGGAPDPISSFRRDSSNSYGLSEEATSFFAQGPN